MPLAPAPHDLDHALVSARCLRCRYPRTALPAGVPCPECGEPEPPRDWVIIQGRSVPGNPLWFVAGASLLLTMITIPALAVMRTGRFVFLIHASILLVAAIYLFHRARVLLQTANDGGDVTWILKPNQLEVRGPHGSRETPWSAFENVLFERGFAINSVRLTVTRRGAIDDRGFPSIWIDIRIHDARELQRLARERIALAAPGTTQSGGKSL